MVKTLSASDSPEVNTLVSRAFGYITPHTFFDDFPVWDLRLAAPGKQAVHSFGIVDGGAIVSHVGARIAEIQTPAGLETVGLIGAVATDSQFRGRGHSSTLMKHAIKHLENHKCEWQILWGSEHDYYAKLGFGLAGEQARAPISGLMEVHQQDLKKFDSIKTGMDETIFRALKAVKNGVVLHETDRKWVFSHKTVKWFFSENPFAYIAYGRGMDMGHIVHEFGGNKNSLMTLLSNLYLQDSMTQIIGTEKDLLALGFQHGEIIMEHLCLARNSKSSAPYNQTWNKDFWISGLGAC